MQDSDREFGTTNRLPLYYLQLTAIWSCFYFKMTKKQQFLLEHNQLSPLNLQATTYLLSRFRIEKASLFKDNNWSIEKLRRPFVLWLTSLTSEEKKDIKKRTLS